MRRMEEIALHDKELKKPVAHTISVPGYSILTGTNLSNVGGMFVILKPFDQRKGKPGLTAKAVAEKMRQIYRSKILSANIAVFGAPPIDGLGNTGRLQAAGAGSQGAPKGRAPRRGGDESGPWRLAQPGWWACSAATAPGSRKSSLYVDRELASSRGVDLSKLYDTLGIYFGSAYVNDFTRFGRNWQVIVQADPRFSPADRRSVQPEGSQQAGAMVSLGDVHQGTNDHRAGHRESLQHVPLGRAERRHRARHQFGRCHSNDGRLAKRELPTGMGFAWTELSYQEIEAGKDPLAPWIFPMSVAFVFMVLAVQYESMVDAFRDHPDRTHVRFVGLGGGLARQSGQQYLHSNRTGGSCRHGREKRDSRGPVREAKPGWGMTRTEAVIHAGKVRFGRFS